MNELKGCPFCNSQPIGPEPADSGWWIECEQCEIVMDRDSKSHLIECWEKRHEFNNLQNQLGRWAENKFPSSNNRSITNHLKREVKELKDSNEPSEAADCLLLLLHHAHKNGYDLLEEAKKKFEIVKLRRWGEPDAEGVVEHIPG